MVPRSIENIKTKAKLTNTSDGEILPTNADDDLERIVDDYLLSELVRQSAENKLSVNSDKIDDEICNAWIRLEEIRIGVLAAEEKNLKLQKLIMTLKSLEDDISLVQPFIDSNLFSDENFTLLSKSLERSRHNLQVKGGEIGKNAEKICSTSTLAFQGSTFVEESATMTDLQQTLSETLREFESCREDAGIVEDLCVECGSLKLSCEQVTDADVDRIRRLLNVPV